MHFRGVELTKPKAVKYCTDNTCTNLIPICCLFITPECSDNPTKWHHITAGEHVCSICYNYLYSFFSYENENQEINEWKQAWLSQSHENPTIYDYITNRLLSNWYSCCECGKWRQVNRDIVLSPLEIHRFSCATILQYSKNPCGIVEDQRIDFIRIHPATFYESVKYSVFLSTSPYQSVYDEYSLDTVGLSPVADLGVDFDLGPPCQGFMNTFNPFARSIDSSRTGAGSIDPVAMDKWEHEYFPIFTGNMRSVFIGLRNLMLLLWAAEPKRPITMELLERCVFVRGLARVSLLVNSLPDMIRMYSAFAFINFGFPLGLTSVHHADTVKKDTTLASTASSETTSTSSTVVVIGAGLSGLSAARHLALMGNHVIVLEATQPTDKSDQPMSDKLHLVTDCLGEVYGSLNNPLSVMAHQLDIDMKPVCTDLSIFDSQCELVPDSTDQLCQDLVYNFVAHLMECSSIIDASSQHSGSTLHDIYQQYRLRHLQQAGAPTRYHNNNHHGNSDSDDTKTNASSDDSSWGARHADLDGVEHVYLSEIEYRVCGGASLSRVVLADIDYLCPTASVTMGAATVPVGEVPCNFSSRNQFSGPTTEPTDSWHSLVTALVTDSGPPMAGSIDIRYGVRVTGVNSTTSPSNNTGPDGVITTITKWHINTDAVAMDTECEVLETDRVLVAMSPWNVSKIVFHDTNSNSDDIVTITGNESAAGLLSNSIDDANSVQVQPGDPFFVIQLMYAPEDRFWHDRLCLDTVTCPPGTAVVKRDISFAITPDDMASRGFCHMFKEVEQHTFPTHDNSSSSDDSSSSPMGTVVKSVLYTHIFGLAARECASLPDEEIASRVLAKLAPLCRRESRSVVPAPLRYEISRVEHALWPCTDWGRRHRHVRVAERHQASLGVTNKVEWLAEPASLSSSICAGLEAAASLARHMV